MQFTRVEVQMLIDILKKQDHYGRSDMQHIAKLAILQHKFELYLQMLPATQVAMRLDDILIES